MRPGAGHRPAAGPRLAGQLRPFVGIALAGYGLLVLLGLLAHESRAWGAAALVAGAALMAWGLPRLAAPRRLVPVVVGLACVVGLVAYNAGARSGLGAPELGILAYGMALLCAVPFLGARLGGRLDVATLVGWSFPLLLAPLAVFALDASVSGDGFDPAGPVVQALVVAPTRFGLESLGTPVARDGSTLLVATPRGTLSLGVGFVCAGLYPMVLFAGVLGLHAWRTRMPPRQLAIWATVGLGGLWAVNLLRLVVLARVGIAQGPAALQAWHANLGWLLFALFMAVFWTAALRKQAHPTPQPTT